MPEQPWYMTVGRDQGDETPEYASLADIDPRLGYLQDERAHGRFPTDGEQQPHEETCS